MIIADWPTPKTIRCLTTTRDLDGVSPAPFDQFNLSLQVNDHPEYVQKNRQRLQALIGSTNSPLWLQQTHGDSVYHVKSEAKPNQPRHADAAITQTPNQICAILTADCLPIALYHPNPTTIALIHAGWRGLINGLIANTLKKFPQPYSEIIAWLGPCIQQQNMQVSDYFIQSNFANHPYIEDQCIDYNQGKPHMSLQHTATLILNQFNISQIYRSSLCTFDEQKQFFSHRRDKANTGRMATLLWFQE